MLFQAVPSIDNSLRKEMTLQVLSTTTLHYLCRMSSCSNIGIPLATNNTFIVIRIYFCCHSERKQFCAQLGDGLKNVCLLAVAPRKCQHYHSDLSLRSCAYTDLAKILWGIRSQHRCNVMHRGPALGKLLLGAKFDLGDGV